MSSNGSQQHAEARMAVARAPSWAAVPAFNIFMMFLLLSISSILNYSGRWPPVAPPGAALDGAATLIVRSVPKYGVKGCYPLSRAWVVDSPTEEHPSLRHNWGVVTKRRDCTCRGWGDSHR